MDKQITDFYAKKMREFEQEIMLLVNERLHQRGGITTEMYIKAKELILKT